MFLFQVHPYISTLQSIFNLFVGSRRVWFQYLVSQHHDSQWTKQHGGWSTHCPRFFENRALHTWPSSCWSHSRQRRWCFERNQAGRNWWWNSSSGQHSLCPLHRHFDEWHQIWFQSGQRGEIQIQSRQRYFKWNVIKMWLVKTEKVLSNFYR